MDVHKMTSEDRAEDYGPRTMDYRAADGESLPAKVKPHNASHLHTTLNYSTGERMSAAGDGSVNPLTRQFCEINPKLDNGHRSRCNVHVSHLGPWCPLLGPQLRRWHKFKEPTIERWSLGSAQPLWP